MRFQLYLGFIIFLLFVPQLAFALILTGGVGKQHDNGTHQRGESHMLLIGDPGTGKSQFLRFA